MGQARISDGFRRSAFGLLLLLWAGSALLFALDRFPYDDEWFSLTLVTNTDWAHFWHSLANDLHPPLLALLDRVIVEHGGGRPALTVLRVAVTTAAIFCVASTLRHRAAVP